MGRRAAIEQLARSVAIYVRVSTGAQEEEGSSLETQEAGCRAFARENGLVIAEDHIYREVHTGVELWERPQMTRLREAVKRGKVGLIIAYAIDRLARDPTHLGVIISEVEYHGGEVRFVTEDLDNSPEGQLIRFVRGYAAKVEHEKIRERSMRGKRARVESGKLPNAAGELYGYRRDKERGVRHTVPDQAVIVMRIYREVTEGVSIRGVISRLNDEGIPPPSAGNRVFKDPSRRPRWGKGAIQRILQEPAYKGETWAWRWQSDPKRGQSVLRPENEWVRLPDGTTPAIVSEELWQAAQDRLHSNRGEATRNQKRQYLLRGLAHCAKCGLPLYSCPEKDRRMYRCSSKDQPSGSCGASRVPADEVEEWAWEQVKAVIADPAIIAAELERRQSAGPEPHLIAEVDALRAQFDTVGLEIARLVDVLADNTMPYEVVRQKIQTRQKERSRLQCRISDIEARLNEQEAFRFGLDALAPVCKRLSQRVEQLGFEGRRLALEALAVRVTAIGCGRRKSPLDWRIEGSIPLDVESTNEAEMGVLTQISAGYGRPPPPPPALASRAPDRARPPGRWATRDPPAWR